MGLIDLPQSKWGSGTGRQPILKGDFAKEQAAILQVAELMPPPIPEWVDATQIKVPATADCPAKIMMSGFPNILHPGMVGGGLTDGRYRENITDVTLDFDLSASLWGLEKVSQWYLNYGLAGNADEVFTLKAMPYMRVKSQASQVISLGTLVTPATGIGYGFTTDELIGGMIYVHTGASRGLVRTISANNNNNTTGGTITYSGAALTLAAGNWFAVLPPATNFRLAGTIFNDSAGNIVKFRRLGNLVQILASVPCTGGSAVVEDIRIACPLAVRANASALTIYSGGYLNAAQLGHPNTAAGFLQGQSQVCVPSTPLAATQDQYASMDFSLEFCCYKVIASGSIYANSYAYAPGRGF